MAPASKRRKISKERYLCIVCDVERVSSQFPDQLATPRCNHLINMCKPCSKSYYTHMLENTTFVGKLACPECMESMHREDIENAQADGQLLKSTLNRFIELERRRISEETPNWRWCLNVKCDSGQVHKPSKKKTDDVFICKKCDFHHCARCNKPWHDGESCEQYEKRTGGEHALEEAKSRKKIQDIGKPCPNPICGRMTERDGGCAHMYCLQCHATWCWLCGKLMQQCRCRNRY